MDEDATGATHGSTRVQNLTYYSEPGWRPFPGVQAPDLFVMEFKAGIGSLPD